MPTRTPSSPKFATALGAGAVTENPAVGVRLPRSAVSEMLFLEPEQVVALADAIEPHYRTLLRAAFQAGSARHGVAGTVAVP